MSNLIKKPVYLSGDGILTRLADGDLVNIGGTLGPFFTVGGKGVMLEDGSSSAPGALGISLQSVYEASVNGQGEAKIKLQTGRDLVVTDDTDDNVFFRIDSETGKVTITGDLDILGSSIQIDTVLQDSDHWMISPKSSFTTALKIEPDDGVVPIVDLITVRNLYSAAPVFRIDSAGNIISSQNFTIAGTINGVDLAALASSVQDHQTGVSNRHLAEQVDIDPISALPLATNVQEALEALDTKIDNVTVTSGGGNVFGHEHVQTTPSATWTISHIFNTMRATVAIYGSDYSLILPDSVKIINASTVEVKFGTPIDGRAILTLF